MMMLLLRLLPLLLLRLLRLCHLSGRQFASALRGQPLLSHSHAHD
jgi:hypothetical protein